MATNEALKAIQATLEAMKDVAGIYDFQRIDRADGSTVFVIDPQPRLRMIQLPAAGYQEAMDTILTNLTKHLGDGSCS